MHEENNNKPPLPGQGRSAENNNPNVDQSFGQMNFRPNQEPQPQAPKNIRSPISDSFSQEFASTNSGFQTNPSGFKAISETNAPPKFELSTKIRVIYGASAFFGAAIVGLFLGFLNSALQGADMLAELGTVIEITLWFASFVGLLGALKPQEFERIFENLRNKIED